MRSIATTVEGHWNLGHVTPGAVLQQSPTRTVMAIHSDQGAFVAKAYESAWALGLVNPTRSEIDRHLHIFDFLAEQHFGHAPSLLRTTTGSRFVQAEDETICVLALIEGDAPPSTPETWAELGRIAARLGEYGDYPYPYGIPVTGTIAELTRNAERYPFRAEMLRLVATLETLVDQPPCLIHGEINTRNAIIATDGRISLLDWDQAGTGPWPLEAGYPLITTFLSEDLAFDSGAASAFYGAWSARREITADDRELVFTAAVLHGLRYLEFGDRARRWARIQHALAHKDALLAALGPVTA